jgi:hypothetical protein
MKFKVWFTSPISETHLHMIYNSISMRGARLKFRKEWGKQYKITEIRKMKESKDG